MANIRPKPDGWDGRDVWTEIASRCDAATVVKLGVTSKWFNQIAMQNVIWKRACFRDLLVGLVADPGIRDDPNIPIDWRRCYRAATDGSHMFTFRQNEKFMEAFVRMGAFYLESGVALLAESVVESLRVNYQQTLDILLKKEGNLTLGNIKPGIWLAEFHTCRCFCSGNDCVDILYCLDVRHITLFTSNEYRNGDWNYFSVGKHVVHNSFNTSLAVLDRNKLHEGSNRLMLSIAAWNVGAPTFTKTADNGVGAFTITTYDEDEGEDIVVNYHAMRAGNEGNIVAIRAFVGSLPEH